MAALQISWGSSSRVAPEEAQKEKVVTGEGATAREATPVDETPAAPEKSDKPFLVYVVDPEGEGSDFDKVEKVILQDERIAFGSRAFHAVKMSPEDAKADPIVGKAGSEAPRFVVISADYKTVFTMEKTRLSASTTWEAMRSAAAKTYATSIENAVRDMRDVIIEFDKTAGERKVLEEKRARLKEKSVSLADFKEIDAKLALLDERQKKATEREQAVWTLKAKAT
jgi:hypothetical protein